MSHSGGVVVREWGQSQDPGLSKNLALLPKVFAVGQTPSLLSYVCIETRRLLAICLGAFLRGSGQDPEDNPNSCVLQGQHDITHPCSVGSYVLETAELANQ